MESVNSAQPLGSGPLPPRKRKATGEFLNALNLLADSYSKSVKPAERPTCAASLAKSVGEENLAQTHLF